MRAAVALLLLTGCYDSPSPLIIHVANVHYVSRDDFAADLRSQDETIPDADIDSRYAAFLDDAERLQNVQASRLREIVREHGIRQIFVEGVTDANVDAFRAKVDELARFDFDYVYRLMTDEDTEFAERELALLTMDAFQRDKLQLGAVGQLMMSGDDIEVAPLDDDATMSAADPAKLGWRFSGPENDARERAMVKRLIAAGPVAVAVLGKDHDIADDVRAECPGCRVETITAVTAIHSICGRAVEGHVTRASLPSGQ